ncbi:MAG: citryl-CoA lyase [Chloroflexi bacterium]|nr:MAG: citryl-CoA lyase [Chloroflexota bacterium]
MSSTADKWQNYWQTSVSDPQPDEVIIRGYPQSEIIGNLTFSEAAFLVIRGRLPTENEAGMMDGLLCGLLAFSKGPPPFAGRVVASANPQLIAGVAAGVLAQGAHAISPEESAHFIRESYEFMQREGLSIQEAAEQIVADARANKRRIPGVGHPTYRGVDSRAAKLRQLAEKYGFIGERTLLYEAIHRRLIEVTGRDLPLNVDGRMACIMTEMGFDPRQMTGIACLSFIPGIIADVFDEITEGRRLRTVPDPVFSYVGESRRSLPDEWRKG